MKLNEQKFYINFRRLNSHYRAQNLRSAKYELV